MTYEEQCKRDDIVKDNCVSFDNSYAGGVRYFRGLSIGGLIQLIGHGYADANDRQNNGPCLSDIVETLPYNTSLNGYVVEFTRPDTRVSVDTVIIPNDAPSITNVAMRECLINADETEPDFTVLVRNINHASVTIHGTRYWWD